MRPREASTVVRKANAQRPRIIGGRWRGRRLGEVAPSARPTPARVRETLFNWLASEIAGRHCLDLFAGSGVLALEALSRGAEQALLLECDPLAAKRIGKHIEALDATACARVLCRDSLAWLRHPPADTSFDVAFLDPPYQSGLLALCCSELERGQLLRDGALIYTECGEEAAFEAPPNWRSLRTQRTGRVYYSLYRRRAGSVLAR